MRTRHWVLATTIVASCGPSLPPFPLHPPAPSSPDPPADMECVQHVLDGTLASYLPTQVGPYTVTSSNTGAHLHRDGRELDEADGKRLWDTFTHDVFSNRMSTASDGMYSVYTCDDAPKTSCIKVELWPCETNLEVFGTKLAAAVEGIGLDDAVLSVDVTFEAHAPPLCRKGAACTPQQHYSTHGTYDPHRGRRSADVGGGACANDGDCETSGQDCVVWYRAGGAETLEYRQYFRPTFCGCVEQRCRWFQQP